MLQLRLENAGSLFRLLPFSLLLLSVVCVDFLNFILVLEQ